MRKPATTGWGWAGGLVVVFYLVSRLWDLGSLPPFIDELVHIDTGKSARGGNWTAGLGQWKWLSMQVYGLFLQLTDQWPWVRLLNVFTGLGVLCTTFAIGVTLGSIRLAFWSALVYAAIPYALFFDRLALTDSMQALCLAIILLLSIRLSQRRSNRDAVALGVVLSLAPMFKPSGFVFAALPLFVVLVLAKDEPLWRRPGNLWLAYAIFVPAAAWFRLSFLPPMHSGVILGPDLARLRLVGGDTLETFWVMLTPPVFLVAVIGGLALALGAGQGTARRRAPGGAFLPGYGKRHPCFDEDEQPYECSRTAGFSRSRPPHGGRGRPYSVQMNSHTGCSRRVLLYAFVVSVVVSPYLLFSSGCFPRYYVPALPAIALLVGEVFELAAAKLQRVLSDRLHAVAMAAVAAVVLIEAGVMSWNIARDPLPGHYPQRIEQQYTTGWSSGYGLEELVRFLQDYPRPSGGERTLVLRSPRWDLTMQGLNLFERQLEAQVELGRFWPWQPAAVVERIQVGLENRSQILLPMNKASGYPNDREIRETIEREFAVEEVWSSGKPGGAPGISVLAVSARGS